MLPAESTFTDEARGAAGASRLPIDSLLLLLTSLFAIVGGGAVQRQPGLPAERTLSRSVLELESLRPDTNATYLSDSGSGRGTCK